MSRRGSQAVDVLQGRRFRSEAFAGEWPRGFYWHPGESRAIPLGYGDCTDPPAGLVPEEAPPVEGPAGEG